MNRIAILSVVFAGLTFSSCKKERECTCDKTTTITDPSGTSTATDPTVTYEIKEIKGGEAKSWCQKTTEVEVNGNTTTTTENNCKLK
jgi:hypothetical protein